MSDTAWVAIVVLSIWGALAVSHVYDTYQTNETRREVLKTIQVLYQAGHQQEAVDGFKAYIEKEDKK